MSPKTRNLLSAAAVILAISIPLFAHMQVEKSEPAAGSTVTTAPKMVQVWFSEAPDLKVSKMTLTGPSGPVELEAPKAIGHSLAAVIRGAVVNGAYTAAWQSAGDDGHLQKGEFKFTVK
jgi:copper resistance protein C